MRGMQRSSQRALTVKKARPDVPGNAFEAAGTALTATVQPLTGSAAAQLYGLELSRMLLILCGPETPLCEGDGLCVDAAAVAAPDYRVTYVERWPRHQRAHLKWIPEDDRGADE